MQDHYDTGDFTIKILERFVYYVSDIPIFDFKFMYFHLFLLIIMRSYPK